MHLEFEADQTYVFNSLMNVSDEKATIIIVEMLFNSRLVEP